MMPDPVELTAKLIRCPSVTPAEGGALTLLEAVLSEAGFTCTRVDRAGIPNLFARIGPKGAERSFGFNGHTDVVPAGDEEAWQEPPFSGAIRDGVLWGRGATDMKSGVAAFVCAAIKAAGRLPGDGAICLAITGDEEGDATHGTRALLDYMREVGETMDLCLVGEPTSPEVMGEMMKIGRRGSLNAYLKATGKQGHAAYPHKAINPIPAMTELLTRLADYRLDDGTEHFDPSTLAVVTVDTGNKATNVIPAQCSATVNVRFNDAHTGKSLTRWLREECAKSSRERGVSVELDVTVSGESFITPPGRLSELVADAVEATTGRRPEASTSGGTSDARFIKDYCPVVEFGLVGATMHQVDERVPVEQIVQLTEIYGHILKDYFA